LLARLFLLALLGGCTAEPERRPQTIVFFGDSLTEGTGVQPAEAYPALIQEKIKQKQWPVTVINAGTSGNTSADGVARIGQVLDAHAQIDVFVLALGANDIMRRLSPAQLEENLGTILETVKKRYPEARLVLIGVEFGFVLGMFAPRDLDDLFERVAEKHGAKLIPSLLKGVLGRKEFNVTDGLHPNAAGHRVLAETVWPELEEIL